MKNEKFVKITSHLGGEAPVKPACNRPLLRLVQAFYLDATSCLFIITHQPNHSIGPLLMADRSLRKCARARHRGRSRDSVHLEEEHFESIQLLEEYTLSNFRSVSVVTISGFLISCKG